MDMESPWIDLYAPLRAFVTKRIPSGVDPADVVQEVFVRIQAGLPRLRDRERIDAWMFQIARNVIADVFRARERSDAHAARSTSDDPADDDDRSAVVALTSCLGSMIAQLATPYRDAVEQTELRGLTQASAAKAAGLSVSGMKSRVQRGREHLKEIILASCRVELDVRGGVIECEPRSATGCGDPVRPSPCSSDSWIMTNTHQASAPQDTTRSSEAREEATGCCGGPAPAGTSACCVQDATAKAAGESGCGCGPTPAETKTKSGCC